jgi:hypothetical protein
MHHSSVYKAADDASLTLVAGESGSADLAPDKYSEWCQRRRSSSQSATEHGKASAADTFQKGI